MVATLHPKMECSVERSPKVTQQQPIRDLRQLAIDLSGQTKNMSPVKAGKGGVAYDLMEVEPKVAPKNNRFAAAREETQDKERPGKWETQTG